jgi:putative flippase GtrA/poly(3-hydroxybutyrate) depolymerase
MSVGIRLPLLPLSRHTRRLASYLICPYIGQPLVRLRSVRERVINSVPGRVHRFLGWFVLGLLAFVAEVGLIGLLRQQFAWPLWLASAVAGEAVVIARFLTTDRLVFGHCRPTLERGVRFQSAALGSFAASWLVLNASAAALNLPYVAAAFLGSLAAFVWSALTNFLWVWRAPRANESKGSPLRRCWVWRSVWLAGVALLALLTSPLSSARFAAAPSIALPHTVGEAAPGRPTLTMDGVYLPSTVDATRPVAMLLALHGYGSSGQAIAKRLSGCADRYGWILVAPTMVYRDYFDPQQLRTDALQNLPRVYGLVEQTRRLVSGLELQPRLLVYGFSRGAQMAHRFSMVYPTSVAAAATLSAGSYTLPDVEDTAHRPLRFPFGIADLPVLEDRPFDRHAFEQIPFWVGVGAEDTNPDDTSRAWDVYEGRTRVDRAEVFADDLRRHGERVDLRVFERAGHEETGTMRLSACAFLAAHTASSADR